MSETNKQTRAGVLAFFTVITAISIPVLALLITIQPSTEKLTSAQSTDLFPSLPTAPCSEAMTRVQINSSTPLELEISVSPNQTFSVVAVSWRSLQQVANAKIYMLKPDGTQSFITGSKMDNVSYPTPGKYTFISTVSDSCRTNLAYLNISGSGVSSSVNSGVFPMPEIVAPILPGTSTVLNVVCPPNCVPPTGYTKVFSSLQDAIRETPEKGKIFIKNGTYQFNAFTTDNNSQGPKELTIEGESKDGVIIDGSLNIAGVCNTLMFGKVDGKYLVKNLTIKSSGGCAGISVEQNVNFTADNIKVIDSKGAGIYFKGTSLGLVKNSFFGNNKFAGVSMHEQSKVTVTDSQFISNINQGIDLKDTSTGTFTNNKIDNNGSSSVEQVLLANSSYAGFKNNTFTNTKYTAFKATDSSKLLSDQNIFDSKDSSKQIVSSGSATVSLIPVGTVTPVNSCTKFDFNTDQKVDIKDFLVFRKCFNKRDGDITTANCTSSDLNPDSWINIRDFVILRSAIIKFRKTGNCN